MNELLSRLGMKEISPFFDECYEKAKQEKGCPVWMTEDFLREAAEEQPYFGTELDELIAALEPVRSNADLLLFARTLYHMLTPCVHHEKVFGGLAFPEAPEGVDTLPYDIFSFYPIFAHIREAYRNLASRGADADILTETAKGVGGSLGASRRMLGRFGFTKRYFLWCTTHKNGALFKMGRFQYEVRDDADLGVYAFRNAQGEVKLLMKDGVAVHESGFLSGSAGAEGDPAFFTSYHEETDAYVGHPVINGGLHVSSAPCRLAKTAWTLIYTPNDTLVSVHIPADQPFDRETVSRSLEEGKHFFETLYPEKNFRGYMCISWLLSPELSSVLKPTSNILAFGNLYERFPVVSAGLDVFHFVFHKTVEAVTDEVISSLPESNSLERGLKNLYADGGFLHEYGGLILF